MVDAIEKDEASSVRAGPERDEEKSEEARGLEAKIDEVAALHSAPILAQFLRARVHFSNEALDAGATKASVLYAAYCAFVATKKGNPLKLTPFGEAIAALGVKKKHMKDGVHYLNIALRDMPKNGATERDAT